MIKETKQPTSDNSIKNETHLQCGYEHECKNKECLKCPRRRRHNLSLTQAEETVIEDFGMLDLKAMMKLQPKELDLMQDICRNIMRKIFK